MKRFLAFFQKIVPHIIVFAFFSLLSATLPPRAWAQLSELWNDIVSECVVPVNGASVATLECLPAVFRNIVQVLFLFSGVVALFFIVYAGIRYILSRGDPKAVEGAKSTLTWAIIGLIVVLLAFTIIEFIAVFTGASCITQFGFSVC